MSNPDKTRQPDLFRTEQSALNRSYDDTFEVLAVEMLEHDAANNTLVRATKAGAASHAEGQVTVASTATQIVNTRSNRRGVLIINNGSTDVYLGSSGVTTTTGLLLLGVKGAAVTIDTTAAIYGIVSTGTESVSYMELY